MYVEIEIEDNKRESKVTITKGSKQKVTTVKRVWLKQLTVNDMILLYEPKL